MWLIIKTFGKKAWAWCKKHWKLLVGASIPCIIWILTRNSDQLNEVLQRVRGDHEKELLTIDKAHQIESNEKKLAREKYNETISQIEKDHAASSLELTVAKKKEIKRIIEENISDPDEITRQLADRLGLDIVSHN